MRIEVRVKPNSRRNEVLQVGASRFEVRVTSPPVDGKANRHAIDLLSRHFGVPRRCVAILKGASSREKVVEITDP